MRKYTIDEIKTCLFPVFNSAPVDRAILFGSYAKGIATHSSDIDILIDSNGKIKGIDFFGILDDVSEALDAQVELIEASQVIDGSRTQREIVETGVLIYERV